ncbi:DNA primase [Diaphorobacter ruginosibacter]|uniref:DNA primase n=1 Tax=Diaphorobacter ruginosibacter TaxID=1715720 RepID=A0A7G9RSF5_9BURK|nr:DNA primase [Diaphorobacter ruginosibacter]QNN58530.1 DNA primase [Diaphorobacter ruginosibacter]
MSIPQNFIQDLLSRTDVVDVVGHYVQLKKAGANYMGLCPFHGEKSPSFSVSPTKQFYHCFGCGKNGNAIGFLMDHAGLGFREAVQELAQKAGMQVPDDDNSSPQDRERAAAQRKKQATLNDVLEKAGESWRQHLRGSPRAIGYFKGRGVSGTIAKKYGLGYAPEGWRNLASVFPSYEDKLLEESGLVIVGEEDGKRYDRFRDRVMFPIRNVKGECIGYGGRVLGDDKPKYLNSPETEVFHKGRELYGLFEARNAIRDAGYALVTEGYMDVVALAQLGFPNAVATLGTACTPDHVHKLFRFTDTVVFSFDGDSAGRRAARKALDGALAYATDTRSVKFLFLPSEHDPDSFVREYGTDAFAQQVAQAMPLSRFLIEASCEGCDLGSAEGRAHMLANARPLWSGLPDGALKRQLLGELSELGQLPSADLSQLWAQAPQPSSRGGGARPGPASGAQDEGAPWGMPADPAPWEMGGEPSFAPAGEYAAAGGQAPFAQKKPWSGAKGTWKKRWGKDADLPPQPPLPRGAIKKGVDQAVWLVFSHMDLLEELSQEDHSTLCDLPAPHGPVFIWLEAQFLEHGALACTALMEALQGHEQEPFVRKLMTQSFSQSEADLPESGELPELRRRLRDEMRLELRGILNRLIIDSLRRQESELIQRVGQDPDALERYKELQNRRKSLENPRLSSP